MIIMLDSNNGDSSGSRLRDASKEETDGIKIHVQVKLGDGCRREWLLLKMELPDVDTGGKLRILLTGGDASDVIYFSAAFTEEDYRRFREEQGLLMDMPAFPPMIRRLLEMCVADETGQRFFATLEDVSPDAVHLSFVEINAFRRLVHLRLKMIRGTDVQIRHHLAKRLQTLKTSCQGLEDGLKRCQNELTEKSAALTRTQMETEHLKRTLQEKEVEFSDRFATEVQKERENYHDELAQQRSLFQSEHQRLNAEHAASMRRLQNQVASLEYENKDLSERRHRNEANLVSMSEDVKRQATEIAGLKVELDSKKVESRRVGEAARDLDQKVRRMQGQLSAMEQEKQKLNSELSLQSELLKTTAEEKDKLEQFLNEKTQLVVRRETAVKTVTQEIMKANETIKKLQDENRKQNQKSKLSQKIFNEQEKLIAKKDSELEDTRTQLKEQSEANRQWQTTKQSLEQQIESLNLNIERLVKSARTNDNVIQWLNKQLTAAKVRDPGLRVGPPPTSVTSFNLTTPMQSKNMISSTPIQRNADRSDDENKSDNAPQGLDSKYLRPTDSQSKHPPSSTATPKTGNSKTTNKTILQSPTPESVYFS